jgi:hypothetical protein
MSARSPDRFVTITRDREELRALGRIGAHVLHSKYDSRKIAARAREGLAQKFLDEVDPDRTLPEAERLRRAEHARHAHMLRMARLSAAVRRKTQETQADVPAEREATSVA